MPRIFASLAVANLLLFGGAVGLAYLDPAPLPDRHVLLAVMSLLLTCLVQVLAFTYLTVSGKVLTQAVHFRNLGTTAVEAAKSIKKRFARCLGFVALLIVLTTATGAVAWRDGNSTSFHLPSVLVFAAGWLLVQLREFGLIVENSRLLERTLAEYGQGHPAATAAPNLVTTGSSGVPTYAASNTASR